MSKPSVDPAALSSPEVLPAINPKWAAHRRLGDALRTLTELAVTSAADAELIDAVAAVIEQQAAQLAGAPRLIGRIAATAAGDVGSFPEIDYELNPLGGKSNPQAPPITVWFEGDRVCGTVRMGWRYEGPPGCVHGGMVAALFDQFLGIGQILTRQLGVTGTLNTRYIKPTPIDTELRLQGWVERTDGRKSHLKAELWADSVKTASCEAVFICVDGIAIP